MIVCPNCSHQNPESSTQCENCYTPLPQTTSCPNCGASVQTDATFCGQCGFNLQAENLNLTENFAETFVGSPASVSPWDEDEDIEELPSSEPITEIPEPWQSNETEVMSPDSAQSNSGSLWDHEELEEPEEEPTSQMESSQPQIETELEELPEIAPEELSEFTLEDFPEFDSLEQPEPELELEVEEPQVPEPIKAAVEPELPPPPPQPPSPVGAKVSSATQLQIQRASLLHVQTDTNLEIPLNLAVIHIGKPNSQIPPDIDVAGFPNSEVVSRIHADIRVEGDTYYIEDVGSSNGTYINHSPLQSGNRHRLRTGDRISLGKGDLVTFIFQLN